MATTAEVTQEATAEEWRDIPGYPGYQITEDRRVRSFLTRGGKITDTPHDLQSTGAEQYSLKGPDGKFKGIAARILVELTFGPDAPGAQKKARRPAKPRAPKPPRAPRPAEDATEPDLLPELWRPIPGQDGYEVSTRNRVRSFWGPMGKKVGDPHILRPVPYVTPPSYQFRPGRPGVAPHRVPLAELVRLAWPKGFPKAGEFGPGRAEGAYLQGDLEPSRFDKKTEKLLAAWLKAKERRMRKTFLERAEPLDEAISTAARPLVERLWGEHGGKYVLPTGRVYEAGPLGEVVVYALATTSPRPVPVAKRPDAKEQNRIEAQWSAGNEEHKKAQFKALQDKQGFKKQLQHKARMRAKRESA